MLNCVSFDDSFQSRQSLELLIVFWQLLYTVGPMADALLRCKADNYLVFRLIPRFGFHPNFADSQSSLILLSADTPQNFSASNGSCLQQAACLLSVSDKVQ